MVKTAGGTQMCLLEVDFAKPNEMEAVADKESTGTPNATDQAVAHLCPRAAQKMAGPFYISDI